ncbi:MAG: transcription elongation factor GreA [Patescibacteria group bacterium]
MQRYLTSEGFEQFKKELKHLKTIGRKEIAERIKHAASFGDLKENFAYHQAKEDQAFLEGKILELTSIIREAKIIEKPKNGEEKDKVQIGSIVTISSNGSKQKFQIVGPEEANPLKEKISMQSPLGKAVLGKSLLEDFTVETPEGKVQYKIIEIG